MASSGFVRDSVNAAFLTEVSGLMFVDSFGYSVSNGLSTSVCPKKSVLQTEPHQRSLSLLNYMWLSILQELER